jgi:hypothetical protein
MKARRSIEVFAALTLLALSRSPAAAETVSATLNGFKEVPAISTPGSGSFTATINDAGTAIDYSLTYNGLEGADVLYAHIHLSRRGINGGVAAFLCGGGGKPDCPDSGTVTGSIVPADVEAISAQGLEADNLSALIDAIRRQATYVNVHTNSFQSGEIRGNVK